MRTTVFSAQRTGAGAIVATCRRRRPLSICVVAGLLWAMNLAPMPAMAQVAPQVAPQAAPQEAPAPAAPSSSGPAVDLPTTAPQAPVSGEAPQGTIALPGGVPVTPAPASADRSHLPHDLSPRGMFMAADMVVKGVMIGLAVASFAVWTVWLAKIMELIAARFGLRLGLRALTEAPSLDSAATHLTRRAFVARGMVQLAQAEIDLSEDVLNGPGLKERVASRLSGLDAALTRRMRRGMSLLATVGAIGPFVGLFGTVWGIMNSFIGISKSQTTSLAVVAPGIAEALLATGIGLVAAIPAVILYNQLNRSIATYRALVRETNDEVQRLVSRDLDRRAANRPPAALVRRG